jgi:hypothetical protein
LRFSLNKQAPYGPSRCRLLAAGGTDTPRYSQPHLRAHKVLLCQLPPSRSCPKLDTHVDAIRTRHSRRPWGSRRPPFSRRTSLQTHRSAALRQRRELGVPGGAGDPGWKPGPRVASPPERELRRGSRELPFTENLRCTRAWNHRLIRWTHAQKD